MPRRRASLRSRARSASHRSRSRRSRRTRSASRTRARALNLVDYRSSDSSRTFSNMIRKRSVIFNFSVSRTTYGEKLLSLIENELIKRSVTSFVDSGTTKIVYENKDGHIIKVVVLDENLLDRMIREPIEMMKNADCNTPRDILLIGGDRIFESVQLQEEEIGTYRVLLWTEDKAHITDLQTFPGHVRQEAQSWFQNTKLPLIKKGFTDLGPVNVGYFQTVPYFRWIDIQPIPH